MDKVIEKNKALLLEALGHELGERGNAYQALLDYCWMERRSLGRLAERYKIEAGQGLRVPTRRVSTLENWSSRYNWQHRVTLWDLALAEIKQEEWLRRAELVNDLDWNDGQGLREAARETLERIIETAEPSLGMLAQVFAAASKLQRLATNEPTDNVNLTGYALDAAIEKEISRFRWKVDAGAHAAITQPVFDADQLLGFLDVLGSNCRIPILAGIWPLASVRNAEFLANEVPGVTVPKSVIDRMAAARESNAEREEGEKIALEIVEKIIDRIQGAQIAAPFGRISAAVRVLEEARRMAGKS